MARTWRTTRPVWALLLTTQLLGSGCTVLKQDYGHPVPEAAAFRDGQTHYRDVLESHGPPATLSKLDDGLVFLYERSAITERQIGINIDYDEIPILKIVLGRETVKGETAIMAFDPEGILLAHDWEAWHRHHGWGAAVQLFISVTSVTDPMGYDRSPQQYLWGASLLNSQLAEALNRDNNLDSGEGGVQRLGSPTGAGQHTLELTPLF